MSKRFLLERFLGLTEEEMQKNEKLWREERDNPDMQPAAGQDLRSVGISPGNMDADIGTGEEIAAMEPAGGLDMTAPGAAPGLAPAPGGVPAGGMPPAA
jgi:hypothetical protein